jgi:lysozyme
MSFQMGTAGLLGFQNTLQAIRSGNYEAAASGMMASAWARQTPARAQRMANLMRAG